ncbi:MAG: glycerol-3-phosphate acyltransferase [Muribaculaceae bacterium]|nr:glycerol-3-phosphate acyltransferase [Alistipes senegalensis]MCM1474331.1 glycerol-3-phosphate acyltransferase [Muribaculaceae bacterium]
MHIVLCSLLGYLIGNINPAYILSRLKGFDIREKGTGNAGASNVTVVMGKKAGVFTALFDIFKAFSAVIIAVRLFPNMEYAEILAGVSCIMGHIFPFIMKFHGGKGLACLGGVILSFNPVVFILMLLAELIFALAVDYICVVAPSGAVIFTLIYAFMTGDLTGTSLLTVVSVVIVFKHIENFRRIRNGEETHISFLWKKN